VKRPLLIALGATVAIYTALLYRLWIATTAAAGLAWLNAALPLSIFRFDAPAAILAVVVGFLLWCWLRRTEAAGAARDIASDQVEQGIDAVLMETVRPCDRCKRRAHGSACSDPACPVRRDNWTAVLKHGGAHD